MVAVPDFALCERFETPCNGMGDGIVPEITHVCTASVIDSCDYVADCRYGLSCWLGRIDLYGEDSPITFQIQKLAAMLE